MPKWIPTTAVISVKSRDRIEKLVGNEFRSRSDFIRTAIEKYLSVQSSGGKKLFPISFTLSADLYDILENQQDFTSKSEAVRYAVRSLLKEIDERNEERKFKAVKREIVEECIQNCIAGSVKNYRIPVENEPIEFDFYKPPVIPTTDRKGKAVLGNPYHPNGAWRANYAF